MKQHHNPTPSEIVQRFKFNSLFRHPGESVSTFVSELRSLCEFCNFGATLDDMLRDRLVCGINDDHVQRRLLAEDKLTFKRALEMAQAQETAAKNAQNLQCPGARPGAGEIHRLGHGKDTSRGKPAHSPTHCYRCEKSNHTSDKCRFQNAKCHNCGKVGHIKAACRSSASKGPEPSERTGQGRPQSVKLLQEPVESSPEEEYQEESALFRMETSRRQPPFEVELMVDGQSLTMEIDTGASLSVV